MNDEVGSGIQTTSFRVFSALIERTIGVLAYPLHQAIDIVVVTVPKIKML